MLHPNLTKKIKNNCIRASNILYLCFFITLYYKQTNKQPTNQPQYGRRRSSFDFYKPKKCGQSKSLCPWFGSGWAKHFGASAFEAIRNFPTRCQWHVQSRRKDAVLSGAVAKLRLSPAVVIVNFYITFHRIW